MSRDNAITLVWQALRPEITRDQFVNLLGRVDTIIWHAVRPLALCVDLAEAWEGMTIDGIWYRASNGAIVTVGGLPLT